MLRRGMADRRWTSSKTRCGVFAAIETEVRARPHQQLHACRKIVGEVAESPRVKQGDTVIDVEAVDDHVRISSIRLPGAIARNDGAVVVDSGLRPKPADHP